MQIREIPLNEFDKAFCLVSSVFREYDAPDYTEEGIKAFYNTWSNPDNIAMLKIYGAFDNEQLVAVLATRNSGNHITMFFIDGKYHGKGIGRQLFTRACSDNSSGRITVNSSPFAREIYHHLGFTDTDTEQLKDGIRFTPMLCILNP
jgi:GNAT superfamily N-acetyltransferase